MSETVIALVIELDPKKITRVDAEVALSNALDKDRFEHLFVETFGEAYTGISYVDGEYGDTWEEES